ncbi:hypothetical protein G7046_g5479 [Stylonectria norvegica]|nr:hypothetical protein G7046_g5479 [Stylonectria norvegica]
MCKIVRTIFTCDECRWESKGTWNINCDANMGYPVFQCRNGCYAEAEPERRSGVCQSCGNIGINRLADVEQQRMRERDNQILKEVRLRKVARQEKIERDQQILENIRLAEIAKQKKLKSERSLAVALAEGAALVQTGCAEEPAYSMPGAWPEKGGYPKEQDECASQPAGFQPCWAEKK